MSEETPTLPSEEGSAQETPTSPESNSAGTDWEARYKELETKLGQMGTQIEEERQKAKTVYGTIEDAMGAADINVNDALGSIENSGSITDEQRAKLREVGVSDDVIDREVGRLRTVQEATRVREQVDAKAREEAAIKAAGSVGASASDLAKALDWAKNNLPEDVNANITQRAADNNLVAGAMIEVIARYRGEVSQGEAPNITGHVPSSVPPRAFTSQKEAHEFANKLRSEGKNPFRDPEYMARFGAGRKRGLLP